MLIGIFISSQYIPGESAAASDPCFDLGRNRIHTAGQQRSSCASFPEVQSRGTMLLISRLLSLFELVIVCWNGQKAVSPEGQEAVSPEGQEASFNAIVGIDFGIFVLFADVLTQVWATSLFIRSCVCRTGLKYT